MRSSEVNLKIQEWEAAGFKFIGNGFENNEEDPTLCPQCGRSYIFWALWEHPTLTRYIYAESEYNPHLLNGINHCYDCDYHWIDEQSQSETDARR